MGKVVFESLMGMGDQSTLPGYQQTKFCLDLT